jgi:hypothetical protein
MKKPKARLRRLKLTELSLVDAPANPEARITLHKRAQDEDAEMRFQKITDTAHPASFDSLEAAMAEIRKVEGCSRLDAMRQAARDHPDLLRKYNAAGMEAVEKLAEDSRSRTKPPAVENFDLLVDAIMERDKVSRSVAMQRARRENPREFEAYQAA